jgi:hypothetical protein
MRRSLFGLLTVVAIAALFVMTGCERDSTLRVASVNSGNSLQSDLADFFKYFDKEDSEWVTVTQSPPDSVEIQLEYVEIGAGLPTWTPFEAVINRATITYTSKSTPPKTYDNAVVPMTAHVIADQTNKKTTKFWMTVASSTWKNKYYPSDNYDETQVELVDIVEASIKFSGWDASALRTVEATGKLQIEFGNFYDDPSKFGK